MKEGERNIAFVTHVLASDSKELFVQSSFNCRRAVHRLEWTLSVWECGATSLWPPGQAQSYELPKDLYALHMHCWTHAVQ